MKEWGFFGSKELSDGEDETQIERNESLTKNNNEDEKVIISFQNNSMNLEEQDQNSLSEDISSRHRGLRMRNNNP